MAKVSLDGKAPQIATPVGSVKEVQELGAPLRNIATCSERDGNKNKGCPVYHLCDRAFKDSRPQLQIGRVTTRDGRVRTSVGPCFNWIRKEVNAEEKDMLVQIIGGEGDSYTYRGTIRRNANCPDCANGECKRTHRWDDANDIPGVCPKFPPAADHDELLMFAHKVRAKLEGSAQKKEAVRQHHYGPDDSTREKAVSGKRS